MAISKTIWVLVILGGMNLILMIFHFTDYYLLFLKPTGYIIPIVINMIVLTVVGFQSKRVKNIWPVVGFLLFLPVLMIYALLILLMEYSYFSIDSPHNRQSVMIEHTSFAKGETTYTYHFYKTRFGIVGKRLNGQSLSIMVRGPEQALDGEGILQAENLEWVNEDLVQFHTVRGTVEIYLGREYTPQPHKLERGPRPEPDSESQPEPEPELQPELQPDLYPEPVPVPAANPRLQAAIEKFTAALENEENGYTIEINDNELVTRYDEVTGQSWIGVSSEYDIGPIPTQQCSRIITNRKQGYYMLEECTHRWEYMLAPIN